MRGLDSIEIALIAVAGLIIGAITLALYRFMQAETAVRERVAGQNGAKMVFLAAAREALEVLREKTDYAREALSDGGDRLVTWQGKVRDGSQNVPLGDLANSSPEGSNTPSDKLSYGQRAALVRVRNRLKEVNDMPKSAGSDYKPDQTANMYLHRADKARRSLGELCELLQEKEND